MSISTLTSERPPRAALVILATLAVVYALYLGHDFLAPVCLGVVLTALLAPAVRWLSRHHVPTPAAAALTVLASIALLLGAGAALAPPLRNLASEIPRSITAARTRLERFQAPLARLGIRLQSQPPRDGPRTAPATPAPARAAAPPAGVPARGSPDSTHRATTDSTRSATGATSGGAGNSESSAPSGVLAAVGRTFGVTTELLSELIEVLLLAFFLLASQRSWGDKLARAMPDEARRTTTIQAATEMRSVLARYVFVTACINLGQGTVVALVMWALDVPSPFLWGILTFILEFVPFLGGFVMVALLLIAGLASGGSLLHALLAPISYLVISSLQNNLVSPAAYGRGLRLNPWAILLAVMFWYAMWGVAGAFLAVPILAVARVLTAHVPALGPIGVFMEE